MSKIEKQTAEDICKLIDTIELSYRDTSLKEWKAFKRIRNAIRDKYIEIPNKKTAKLIRIAEKELEEGNAPPLFDNAKDAIDWLND